MILSPRQRNAARKLLRLNGGPVWWRVGTGKTRVALRLFAMIAKRSLAAHGAQFLVVSRREAFFDWENELKKAKLTGWRIQIVEEEQDLYSSPFSARHPDRSRSPCIFLISHGKLARLEIALCDYGAMLDMVCYDEGFLYKNPQSEHCRVANAVTEQVGIGIILSGSIMTAKNLTDVYGQLYAINKHQPLGKSLTAFRSRYMHRFAIFPARGDRAACWVNSKDAGKRVAEIIRPTSSIYFPNNSKRRIRESIINVSATCHQIAAFNELREYCSVIYEGKPIDLKNMPSVIIKAQQISDGFLKVSIPLKKGDFEHKVSYFPTLKQEWLIGKIGELISCGESVVVWCAFKITVELLLQRLQKDMPSMGVYAMHGGRKFDVDGWRKNGRVAIATEASGSSVNHFKDCAYGIYYSMDTHWLHLQQSRGRTDREDSKHSVCFYYHLEVKKSFDSFIRRTAQSSGAKERELIQQATLEAINKWLIPSKE